MTIGTIALVLASGTTAALAQPITTPPAPTYSSAPGAAPAEGAPAPVDPCATPTTTVPTTTTAPPTTTTTTPAPTCATVPAVPAVPAPATTIPSPIVLPPVSAAPATAPVQAADTAQVPPLDNALLPAEPAADQPVAPDDDELSSKTAEPDPDWTPTEDPNGSVVPGEMRSDREEIPAGATKEMADLAETMEARQRMSRAAVGCQTYWPFPYEVCGLIRDKYNSLGGPGSFLSYPNSPEYTNPDGVGKRTQFLNGPIYWSAASGAHPVVNSFLNRWQLNGYEAGRLKYPTTDEIVLPDGGRRQEFQQGVIYVAFQNAVGSALINGPLRDKYNSVGGLTPGTSFLGYPTEDQKGLPDGQGQMDRFQNGVIYWHPVHGAHPISGLILNIWQLRGYEGGVYGYPTDDGGVDGNGVPNQQFSKRGMVGLTNTTRPIGGIGTENDPDLGLPDGISWTFQEVPEHLHEETVQQKLTTKGDIDNFNGDRFFWYAQFSQFTRDNYSTFGGATPTDCAGELYRNGVKDTSWSYSETYALDETTLDYMFHARVLNNQKTQSWSRIKLQCSWSFNPGKYADALIYIDYRLIPDGATGSRVEVREGSEEALLDAN